MQILCLTSRLPYPPTRGDRLRAYNFIKHLSAEHTLHLVSFIAQDAETQYLDPLKEFCRQIQVVRMSKTQSALAVARNIWRPEPLQTLYYRSKEMRRRVNQMLSANQFDAVYVHLFRMAPYVAGYSNLYRILDLTDVISSEVKRSMPYRNFLSRTIYGLEQPRIARVERQLVNTFDEAWLISRHDHQLLANECPSANILVIPNGVDVGRFYPTDQPPRPNSLIFVGHLGVFHNIDAVSFLVQAVLPLVRQRVSDCSVNIVGAEPVAQVQSLAQNPAVTVTGFVDDLNAYLNKATVFVAPLRFAAGVQNKVLEAMAAGRPVVTTSVVNKGLGASPGLELFVADTAPEMADCIVSLLNDADLASAIGRAGRKFVQQHFGWHHAVDRMRVIEARLTQAGQP